jgi:tetratricopeptide (TPR) repeat protein
MLANISLDTPIHECYVAHIMSARYRFSGLSRYGLSRFIRWAVCSIAVLALLTWVLVAAHHHWWRASLLTALAGAAFVIGSLVGFIFSTYEEEVSTIGKLKDWLIGAVTTITLIKFASLKPVLVAFAVHDNAREFALTLGVSIVFLTLGFFFMYFGRELLFNVPLARKRDERSRIETHQAGVVTLQLLSAIPSSLLVGISDVEDLVKSQPKLARSLREGLYSADVERFLDQSDSAIRTGLPLDWDVVSKNAYIHYYRTYFADVEDKEDEAATALDWILRALVINPEHIDLTVKRADILALLNRYKETVAILERLHLQPECPAFVEQWLGYYLLLLPGHEDESITCNTNYLNHFPDMPESRRNLACGWAQKYCRAYAQHQPHHSSGKESAPQPLDHTDPSYQAAIHELEAVIRNEPGYRKHIREQWSAPHGSFSCFLHDAKYRSIVGLPAEPADSHPTPPGAAHMANHETSNTSDHDSK